VSAGGVVRAAILVVAGSVVGLAVVEAGLRAIGFSSHLERPRSGVFTQVTEYDPVLSRRNRPGFVDDALGIRIDALGFRGDEVEPAKPAGRVRIACLGDSATFGVYRTANGNRFDGSYPEALAELARADGHPNVEVVNAGVLGATSADGLVLLLVRLRRISPDVLVVRFGNNDHGRRWERDTTPLGVDAEYAVLHDLPPRVFDLEVSSLVFHVYRQAVAGRRPAAPRRLSPERFETNLRRFVEVGREIGARVVFVDFPYRDAARGPSPGEPLPNPLMAVDSIEALHALHAEYQRVVERVAVATDTPFVRTAAALHAVEAEAFTDWDATHPTPAGQRVIARAILDEVERMGVLPPRGAR
jgi:lysophospholipase L1-like esterase